MAGNEVEVTRFLYHNRGISLPHIGTVKTISYPINAGHNAHRHINSKEDIDNVKTEGSNKKADIYINGIGVSLKQAPTSSLYNRLQRANIVDVFTLLGFRDADSKIKSLDKLVAKYQNGELTSRDIAWNLVFTESDFRSFLELLMMQYSPNLGFSEHPASIIIEAPSPLTSIKQLHTYTFDEYFYDNKNLIVVSLRRSWVGQKSNSEHRRAMGLVGKEGNAPWVFNGAGERGGPRGWRPDYPDKLRKTAYFLMIYKII